MLDPVATITSRCAAVGLPITRLLDESKVAWSCWSRWTNKVHDPTLKPLRRIDAVLATYEAAAAPPEHENAPIG